MTDEMKIHSQQWFDELKVNNPMRASQTRKVIEASGTREVCSICGGWPATLYRIEGELTKTHTEPTFRLCSDCAATQMGLTGKALTAIH